MTVAIALVSVQAMAMAPLIYDMPSVVVGNQATVTQPVKYVYIDAFDLNTVVTDDYTSAPLLKWSYEIAGAAKYTINGDASLNSSSEDPVSPPAAKMISGPGSTVNQISGSAPYTGNGEDALNNTVTIRNVDLYPYGGSPSADQSAAAQAWNTHVQAVTFWCSDGNLASSSTVLFWTDNHYSAGQPIGVQRLSRGSWTLKMTDPMTPGPGYKPWHMYDGYIDGTGHSLFYDHTTSHTWQGAGVCFNVTAAGSNWGSVQSPMPYFTLEQNMVYRIRCTMNSSQASVGKTPLWDFILENWNGDPAKGMNLYGMDSFYVDNEGGANTVLQTTNGSEMTLIWAPAAFQTAQWNSTASGLYSMDTTVTPNVPRYGAVKDPCVRFRVLDLDSNAALKNDQKSGDICLTKCIVEACNYNRCSVETGGNVLQVGGTKPWPTDTVDGIKAFAPQNASNTVAGGNMIIAGLTGATATYTVATNTTSGATHTHTPGYVTITPSTPTSQQAELVEITPATDRNYTFPGNDILDNYPIPWQTGKIYRLAVDLSAPSTNDAASPWDVLWLSIEPPTNEIDTESFVTANKGFAMPKYQTSGGQTYLMFYNSGTETKSAIANLHYLRWRVRFGNSTALNMPNPSDVVNDGAVRLHKITVDKVKFQ